MGGGIYFPRQELKRERDKKKREAGREGAWKPQVARLPAADEDTPSPDPHTQGVINCCALYVYVQVEPMQTPTPRLADNAALFEGVKTLTSETPTSKGEKQAASLLCRPPRTNRACRRTDVGPHPTQSRSSQHHDSGR